MAPDKPDKAPKDQSLKSGPTRVDSGPDPSGRRSLRGAEELSVPGGTEQPKDDRRKRGDIEKRQQR
jgi:hypothetical protein